jgi:hypothetical protein
VQDIKCSFELFIPETIEKIILDCTNWREGMFLERDGTKWTKYIYMHTLGFLSLLVFSDPMENPQNPFGMQKLAENFYMQQCLWKTSKFFPGLSASITESPDQLGIRETSYLQSGQ